jgi:hypothetical protein
MKKCFLLIIFIICAWEGIPIWAQTHRYKLDFTISARNFVDTIPIEYEKGQIYIPVEIEGTTYRFNLDTGSSQGILYTDSPFNIGQRLGKIEVQDAHGHKDSIQAARFPDFHLGNLTIRKYCGTIHRPMQGRRNYDAIIGFDLFNKGLSAKIDVRKGWMILTDQKNLFRWENGHRWKYRLLRFVPHIKLSPYKQCSDEALFDTGSRRLYVMGRHSREVFSNKITDFGSQIEGKGYGSRSIGNFGAEQSDEIYYLHLEKLMLGGHVFTDYHTLTTQGYSRVGAELFSYGTLIILPKLNTMVFQPYEKSDTTHVGNAPTEIAFVPSPQGVMIGMVWENSYYYEQGFRAGDIILSIDGRHIQNIVDYQAYPFIEGRTYLFRVRRPNGLEVEIPLNK